VTITCVHALPRYQCRGHGLVSPIVRPAAHDARAADWIHGRIGSLSPSAKVSAGEVRVHVTPEPVSV
jgi:hypothetical protein